MKVIKLNLFYPISFVLIIMIVISCASQSVLTGGEKDTTPPQIIAEKSSLNYQTNFKKQAMFLVFNEFVKVQDVFNQVVVSPPLEYNPKVESRGKKVIFSFNDKEVLRPNTTYIIQFGRAIQDITESNPAEDLKYIFSTGDIIDSIVLSGRIVDFEDRKPLEGSIAILYDQDKDSMVYTSRPLYFARADKQGKFTITNISPGRYQLVGLKDENNNYKYDNPKELVGFTDSLITLTGDTISGIEISLFGEIKAPLIQDVDSTTKGLLKVRFDRDPDELKFMDVQSGVDYLKHVEGNVLNFWHRQEEANRWYLFYEIVPGKTDSIRIQSYPLRPDMVTAAISCNCGDITGQSQHPDSVVLVRFSRPLTEINAAGWMYRDAKDSTSVPKPVTILERSFPHDIIAIKAPGPGTYELVLNSGAVKDFYNLENDTIMTCKFTILEKSGFGNLVLDIERLNPEKQYIFNILNQGKQVRSTIVEGVERYRYELPALRPSTYTLEVIFDENRNSKWDAGNFLSKKHPEIKKQFTLDPIRPDWDMEQTVEIEKKTMDTDLEDSEEDSDEEEDDQN